MSDATVYSLSSRDALFNHGSARSTLLLKDLSDKPASHEIDALAASGDLFVTLATALDDTASSLTTDASIAHPQLERLVNMLLYLQRHYKISRKPADYRQ
jgi:hypothetical protein